MEDYYGRPASQIPKQGNPARTSRNPVSSLAMQPGDTSYFDVLERPGYGENSPPINGGGEAVENPSSDPSTARANTRLREASKVYYKTQGDAINAVHQALLNSGYDWNPATESWTHIAYETSVNKMIPVGGNSYLHLSMYRMPSGNYELTARVDRGSRQTGRRNPVGDLEDYAAIGMVKKYENKLLRGGSVVLPLSGLYDLHVTSTDLKLGRPTGTRRMRIIVVDSQTGESVSDAYTLGSLNAARIRQLQTILHSLVHTSAYLVNRHNGGQAPKDEAKDFFDTQIQGEFYMDRVTKTDRKLLREERTGKGNPEPGNAFMLSYLPAGAGSYKTIPYPTLSAAKRGMEARMDPARTSRIEIRDMRGNRSTLIEKWDASGSVQRLNPSIYDQDPNTETTMGRLVFDRIRVGSQVWIKNSFGQVRKGRAVMKGPHGWVLNMGGPHGTPDIATPENVTEVSRVTWTRGGKKNPYPEPHQFTPDSFTRAYMEAALWSSTDDDGTPLDRDYSTADLSDETQAKMYADCAKFQELAGDLLDEVSLSQAGHDFWLTRNGHGAGFWDGDYPKEIGEKLTKLSKRFGEYDLYVGDNGTIYGTGGRHVNPTRSGRDFSLETFEPRFLSKAQMDELLELYHTARIAVFGGRQGAPTLERSDYGRMIWASDQFHKAHPEISSTAAYKDLDAWVEFHRGGRRNPEPEAAEMYETFHGEPSREILEVEEEHHYHENLASLGQAIEMVVKTTHGPVVKITFDGNTHIACNESGTQLYVVDGDQSLNLKALGFKGERKGKHGPFTDEKDKMLIGEIQELTYRTRKGFDKFKLTDYYHGLGEESGVRPSLVYDLLNKQMEIVGGQYKVLDAGIVN